MDKISIIIPVYNVGAYVERCLDSVIGQSYQNLEIICIDDGSTDNSGKVCDQYALRDDRIRVIHKPNGGVSSARNAGLEILTGDYVGFIDPDDWIDPDMYGTLYNLIKTNTVSISVINYSMDTDMDAVPMVNRHQIPDGVISKKDMLLYAFKKDYYKGFSQTICNKLFTSDLILNNGLLFDNDVKSGQDTLFYVDAILSGECTGAYCDSPLYHYYQRSSSLSHFNPLANGNTILAVYQTIIGLLEKEGYDEVNIWVKRFHCYFASLFAEIALENNNSMTYAHMQNEIKVYLNEYIETNREFPDRIERINKLLNTEQQIRRC